MKDVVICDKPRRADKQALTRGFPNGGTRHHKVSSRTEYIGTWKQTRRTETSKYPEEKKSTEIPQVAASERGAAEQSNFRRTLWKV